MISQPAIFQNKVYTSSLAKHCMMRKDSKKVYIVSVDFAAVSQTPTQEFFVRSALLLQKDLSGTSPKDAKNG